MELNKNESLEFGFFENNHHTFRIMNKFGQVLTELSGLQLGIRDLTRTIDKVYVIHSCFRNKEFPIYKVVNEMMIDDKINAGEILTISSSIVPNFYDDIDWRLFYESYLIECSNGSKHLVMFGSDKHNDSYYPFVLSEQSFEQEHNEVSEAFQYEYLELSRVLEGGNGLFAKKNS